MSGVDFLETPLDGANVDWMPLGDVVTVQRGKRLVKSQLEEIGNYAVFQNSMTPLGYYHESNVQSDTAFVIAAGAAGEIGYSDYEFWAADDIYFCLPSNKVRQKYLYHFLLMKKTRRCKPSPRA